MKSEYLSKSGSTFSHSNFQNVLISIHFHALYFVYYILFKLQDMICVMNQQSEHQKIE